MKRNTAVQMRRTARWLLLGLLALPAAVQADVRFEETGTTLDSTISRWIAVKGDRRAVVTRAEPKGALFHAGARYGAAVEIARPDRDLIWELDPQERSYREITHEQFRRLVQKGVQAPRSATEQYLRSIYQTETTQMEVTPTGKMRRIAGYDAEQVMARVVVGAQRPTTGARFTFTFDQEVWLCRDEALLKEVRPFEEAYVEAFGTAMSLQQASVAGGEWGDAFILPLRALNDRIRALNGVALAMTTSVVEEAVAQTRNEKGTTRKFTVSATEVRRVQIGTIPEAEFEVPAGFINSETKVAAVGPASAAPAAPEPPAPAPAAPAGPKPTLVAVAPPATPISPRPLRGSAGTPQPAATPPRVAALPAPDPAAPADPVAPPKPVAPVRPSPAVAAAPPSAPAVPAPAAPRVVTTRSGVTPVFVENTQPSGFAPGVPVVMGGLARTQAPPPPVTIDEPELPRDKKRRRR